MTAIARLEALPDTHQPAAERRSGTVAALPPELPRYLQSILDEPPGPDRSGQVHRAVAAALEWGLPDDQVRAVMSAHTAGVDKYGNRLDDEVDRVLAKLRPEHEHAGQPCDRAGCPNRPRWMTDRQPRRSTPRQAPVDSGADRPPPLVDRAGWEPVDLGPYLDGSYQPPTPVLLRRTDSLGLLYPGRLHWLSGEPECGKSWLALLAAAQVLLDGGRVVYIDLEDDAGGTPRRLIDLGVPAPVVLERFGYVTPEGPLTDTRRELLAPVVDSAELVVVDACTESMAQQSLDDHKGTDVASWLELLPRWAARRGPAVLVLDHVVKSEDNRGRWATGSGHKLAGLSGAAYALEAVEPAGRGLTGRSRLWLHKDRHGQVSGARTVTLPGRKRWAGDLVVDATGPVLEVALHPPTDRPGTFRPTVLMGRVCEALTRASEPLTVRGVLDRVKGKRDADVRAALALLVDEGYVAVDNGARGAQLHRLVRPFQEGS